MNGKDVEPEVQVLAEIPVGHLLLESPVGGGDDSYIYPHRPFRSDSLELSGLERPKQLGLRFRTQVPDLVEEERAAVRQLEAAHPALRRAGERSALVAEHLGLDQVSRNGGAVHRDERTPGSPARGVDGRRHQLFAGARLAGDQDAGVGGADPLDERGDLPHGATLTDQGRPPCELGLERAVLGAGPVELEGRAYRHQHCLRRERLLQELERAELHRPHGVGELCLAAHHDDRGGTATLAEPCQRVQAIRARAASAGRAG